MKKKTKTDIKINGLTKKQWKLLQDFCVLQPFSLIDLKPIYANVRTLVLTDDAALNIVHYACIISNFLKIDIKRAGEIVWMGVSFGVFKNGCEIVEVIKNNKEKRK